MTLVPLLCPASPPHLPLPSIITLLELQLRMHGSTSFFAPAVRDHTLHPVLNHLPLSIASLTTKMRLLGALLGLLATGGSSLSLYAEEKASLKRSLASAEKMQPLLTRSSKPVTHKLANGMTVTTAEARSERLLSSCLQGPSGLRTNDCALLADKPLLENGSRDVRLAVGETLRLPMPVFSQDVRGRKGGGEVRVAHVSLECII